MSGPVHRRRRVLLGWLCCGCGRVETGNCRMMIWILSPLSILSHCPCSSAQHCADSSIQQLIVRCMFGRDDMTTPRVAVTGDPRHHLMEETFEHPVTNIIVTTLCCPVILSSGDGRVQAAIISSASSARVHYTITAPEACLAALGQFEDMGRKSNIGRRLN